MNILNENNWVQVQVSRFSVEGKYAIIFPKDTRLYHGGTAALSNAMFPVFGPFDRKKTVANLPAKSFDNLNFIKKMNNKEEKVVTILKDPKISDADKNHLLKQIEYRRELPHFGSYWTATNYANKNQYDGVMAVKLKRNCVLFDFGNAFNVFIMLYGYLLDEKNFSNPVLLNFYHELVQNNNSTFKFASEFSSKFTQEDKVYVAKIFNFEFNSSNVLPQEFPLFGFPFQVKGKTFGWAGNTGPTFRKSLRNVSEVKNVAPYFANRPPYFVPKKMSAVLDENFDGYFFLPFFRAGECIFFRVENCVERDFENPRDYAFLPKNPLSKIIEQMRLYKTSNIDFHSGDLYAHSIWTALWTGEQIDDENSIWNNQFVKSFIAKGSEYKKAVMYSAFFHDIGKMSDGMTLFYDKKNHPEDGFYMFEEEEMINIETGGVLPIKTLILEQFSTNEEQFFALIKFVAALHWDFGDCLRMIKTSGKEKIPQIISNYLDKILAYKIAVNYKTNTKEEFLELVNVLILVSVCDIMAAQTFKSRVTFENSLQFENLDETTQKFLRNFPKTHKGDDKYKAFEIKEKGLILAKIINETIFRTENPNFISQIEDVKMEPLDLNVSKLNPKSPFQNRRNLSF